MNTTTGEIAMKLYLGIRQTASHIHLVALTSQGEAVLKTAYPLRLLTTGTHRFDQSYPASLWYIHQDLYLPDR